MKVTENIKPCQVKALYKINGAENFRNWEQNSKSVTENFKNYRGSRDNVTKNLKNPQQYKNKFF